LVTHLDPLLNLRPSVLESETLPAELLFSSFYLCLVLLYKRNPDIPTFSRPSTDRDFNPTDNEHGAEHTHAGAAAAGGSQVALPVETATGMCFLELYSRFILALQVRFWGVCMLPRLETTPGAMIEDDMAAHGAAVIYDCVAASGRYSTINSKKRLRARQGCNPAVFGLATWN
jgi:hypothetical protein